MTAPMYLAMGGVVFVREHQPITIERARFIEALHRCNANYQLTNIDAHSQTARIGLAKIEQSLADEMAAAIREATAPQEIAA